MLREDLFRRGFLVTENSHVIYNFLYSFTFEHNHPTINFVILILSATRADNNGILLYAHSTLHVACMASQPGLSAPPHSILGRSLCAADFSALNSDTSPRAL